MRTEILIFIGSIVAVISIASIYMLSLPEISKDFCQTDSDCMPAECCHPTSCVNQKYKPNCEGIFCTAVCQGPIDCGAGYCGCVKNKCQVVPLK